MIIFNFKLNKSKASKILLIIFSILIFFLLISVGIKIFSNSPDKTFLDDSIPTSEYAEILPENYTNILKEVHNDLSTYLGQKIKFSGYIYRVTNLKENEFILARDMDIGNNQTVIVGFLCSLDNSEKFINYSWVEVSGEITEGKFNGNTIPVIKIDKITQITAPSNPNVQMPDDSYVPTCVIY